jgi:hypothetical protein
MTRKSISKSMIKILNSNIWWEQLIKFEQRLRCRIFINKLKIDFRQISRRSLKIFILRLNFAFAVIFTALRVNSFDETSSTYSLLFLSMNVCIVNKSKSTKYKIKFTLRKLSLNFYHFSSLRLIHSFRQNCVRSRRKHLKNSELDLFRMRRRKHADNSRY